MKPINNAPQEQVYVAAPFTRVSGTPGLVPEDYTELDYVSQEDVIRQMAHGPAHEWANILHQHEEPFRVAEAANIGVEGEEKKMVDAHRIMKEINSEKGGISYQV